MEVFFQRAVPLLLMLAACDSQRPAEPDRALATDNHQGIAAEVSNTRGQLTEQLIDLPSLEVDGRDFGPAWRIEEVSLGDKWQWRETITSAESGGRRVYVATERERYRVDPRNLAPTEVIEWGAVSAVKLSCRSGDCFEVSERHVRWRVGPPLGPTTLPDERRDENYWFFLDKTAAAEAADALNRLIAST